MQELRLVAVSEDGTYLVLATAGRGTRFTLPVDDRLRAAVRGHFSRLGQFEIEVESPLRPKEIQARIRSGETAEEIAESAGIPVERVRWFEGPVLQEREYMAQQAQRVTVRRPGESTPGPPLGETVEERLGRGGVDLEEVEWDSWKCEDNTWRVRLSFFEGGRPHAAEWTFDPRRRHVSPLDEVAARLTSVDWDDDDAVSDTVTPLVPRRPAMKVVSSDRDALSGGRGLPSRGLPAEPEQGAPEPLRAAEPRTYIVERGRMVDPRPAFREASEPPSLREAAPPRPAVRAPEPPRPAPPAEEAAPEALSAEALADEPATPVQSEEPHGVAAGPGTAQPAEFSGAGDEDAGDLSGETVEAAEENADEAAAAAAEARLAEAAEQPEDEAPAPEEIEALDGDGSGEVPEAEHASAETAEPAGTAPPEQADDDDQEAAEAHEADDVRAAVGEAPEAVKAPEPVQAAPSAEPAEPAEPAETPQAPAASRPRVADVAPRVPEDERETAPVRKPAPAPAATQREPAAESTPAAPARQPSRPPAKKKPAARPTMPAAQDKPATGSPAAAASGEPASQRPARRRKAKGKRASVPSWDEIMFGARRPE
ncbi:septation protein SepH [Actinomadura luteofluorescens]|uniref:septation protein SepH n=1 Tax=Actinomadura luteofluorescens TaxID=46163 RepID=UPI00347C19EE